MAVEKVEVPDLGGAEEVEVIEIAVSPGDRVAEEDTLIVLESDKATMDVPSPLAGVVKKVLVKLGDSVSQGTAIVDVEVEGESGGSAESPSAPDGEAPKPAERKPEAETDSDDSGKAPASEKTTPAEKSSSKPGGEQTVKLPDLGTDEAVEIIEIAVAEGDTVAEGDALMTLEGDKATMDVPSPYGGKVVKVLVSEGDKVKSGHEVAVMEVATGGGDPAVETGEAAPAANKKDAKSEGDGKKEQGNKTSPQKAEAGKEESGAGPQADTKSTSGGGDGEAPLRESEAPAAEVYAGPAVRLLARELGVDLRNVEGTGVRGRIQKADVDAYVKKSLATLESQGGAGGAIPAIPDVDFGKFGEVEEIATSKIARLTATNMSRAWLNVPAVTQFDDADITELEAFRKSLKGEAERRGVKLTPVAFLLAACGRLLRQHPVLNRSWHSSGEKLIQKHYVHIGMAVDTPRGLLVPVVRDVDRKGVIDIAEDVAALSEKARDGKLGAADMQGGCFSISSLGAIGGRGFTPIVNTPEAAILGVSKASVQPVWDGDKFVPRTLLPLSLSYDHRLVNGAEAGRFLTDLVAVLGDIRRLLL